MELHKETERVPHLEPRGQGDIIRLEWPDGVSGPPLGIVLNADCDLAHGKTDGVIAYVPIYPFREYLANFWAAGHITEISNNATQAILKLTGDKEPGSLHSWLKSDKPNFIATRISESLQLKPKQSTLLEGELHRLAVCLDSNLSPIDRFQALCANSPNAEAYAKTHITAAKKAMGDGHFFISELIDDSNIGFVVRMRRIYTLPEADYFISTSEQRSQSEGDRPTAVRIGRLTGLYRFKILQLFAQQYSRIGLPDEITALGALAIDDLISQFAGARN